MILLPDMIVQICLKCTKYLTNTFQLNKMFLIWVLAQVAMLFESFGFGLIDSTYSEDGLDRDEIKWITQIYKHDEVSIQKMI